MLKSTQVTHRYITKHKRPQKTTRYTTHYEYSYNRKKLFSIQS